MFCVLSEISLADIYLEVVCEDCEIDSLISAYFIEQLCRNCLLSYSVKQFGQLQSLV